MDALGDALCGCGDDAVELDERDDLPPTLSAYVINAMQAPHEVLDVHPKAPPWATRDNLRVNCLRLLARRERHFEAYVFRALAAHDAKHGCPGLEARPDRCAPHAAALVAHALLAARATKRTEDLVQRLPRLVGDGHFDGSPDDALHARRPLGAPRSRRRRACGLLATRCVGARWALDADRTAILEFDFEVSYCGRVATVESAPAEAVADALARLQATELRELRLVDAASYRALKPLCRVRGLLQRARKQEDFRRRKTPAEIGRVLARRFMALHRSLGLLLGAYSPALLEGLLRVDVDRVWREEEPRVARSLDPPRPTDPSDVLYLVDEEWLRAWRSWAFYAPPRGGDADPPPPPGPLSNARLAAPPRPPLAPYALGVDYRAVSPSLYAYFSLCHGAADEPGLARRRADPSLLGARAPPARPLAIARVARCLKAAARNRRPVVEAAEDDADDGLDDVAAEVLADVADALLPRAPPPRGGETTCCTPAPKPPDPEAGVELPTLSPLHDALREA